MSGEARRLQRTIRASVREMLSVYRIQAKAGPVSEKALGQIIFRAAHPIVSRLAPYSVEQRAALLPNFVRMMLTEFLDSMADSLGGPKEK